MVALAPTITATTQAVPAINAPSRRDHHERRGGCLGRLDGNTAKSTLVQEDATSSQVRHGTGADHEIAFALSFCKVVTAPLHTEGACNGAVTAARRG
jgi:hypothetical protein